MSAHRMETRENTDYEDNARDGEDLYTLEQGGWMEKSAKWEENFELTSNLSIALFRAAVIKIFRL